ncbi:MAG: DUF2892 domain-containing protein [Eubacteriales bacterium]|jgi:ABC-type Fe3+-siderophore transport system permease subunit|nr:DUF2892 domain-containing protein [Eubacteriales bacterium]
MKKNVGQIDRWIRIALGVVLLSLLVFLSGPVRWIGLIGLVPLITGLIGSCPLYAIFNLNTNKGK